ncbi:MAG: amino acid adenylation domain-containing protein, partial [Clostridium sp.]
VLSVEKVGIKDNFFELGGHSLKAVKLANEIEAFTKIRLQLKRIFENPTVEMLAIELQKGEENVQDTIPKAENKEEYAMSSAQKRIYIVNEIAGNNTTYNIPIVFKIKGNLDVDKLRECLNKLISRHEIFRTSFYMKNGKAFQKVSKEVRLDFEYEETDIILDESKILIEFTKPFDLSKAPLLRTKVIKTEECSFLLIDMHHIISDGGSLAIIMDELNKLYKNEALDDITISYKDYSEWMNGRDLSSQKAYLLNQFNDDIPTLDLPLDYKRKATQSFNGDNISGLIDKSIKAKIVELSKKTGTTEYMILLSAFSIMLSKYSRQEDIIIGSPISGRMHKDTEKIIGMFVNSLAIRTKPEKSKKYIDFLKEIKECCIKSYENQEYPFEELVDELNINKDLSRNPLFDVVFTIQKDEERNYKLGDLELSVVGSEYKISKFDITLTAIEYDETYALNFEYCTDLFNQETMLCMMKHYIDILKQLVNEPEKCIDDIEIATEEEKKSILLDFNKTEEEYPRDKCIQEIFEEMASKYPNKTAVICKDKQISYKELNEKANSIANILRNKGIKPDDFVGIMTERSIETIIGIYGIMKAGGAYVPIDISYPEERVNYMLEDSKSKLLLIDNKGYEFKTEIEKINLNDKSNYLGNIENLELVNKPEDLAYLIYTSGTTGKPKGVMIEHRGVLNLRQHFKKSYKVTEEDIALQFANIVFDASVLEMTMSLLVGGTLLIVPDDYRQNIKEFEKYVKDNKGTITLLPPPFLAQVNLETIKTMVSGGSESSREIVEKTIKNNSRYINAYGPTESTVCATYWEYEGKIGNKIPIGKPITNTKIYILNKDKLCGIGIPGEICIASEGLARGYLNREDLTKEKFVENPIVKGERIYRTGDLGRWLIDGNIEYMGRIDEQVKVRGFRIELGEIESVLRKQKNIEDVAVVLKGETDKYICAYIVSEEEVNIEELKKEINKELPDYMIPSQIAQIEKIPMNASGKVDKKALPEIARVKEKEYIAPRNEEERVLVKVFEEILGVDNVGIKDNFFQLGGDSIKATVLINKIEELIGVRVPFKEVFLNPTIEELSKAINNKNVNEYKSIPKATKKEYYDMSSSQKRFFVVGELDDDKISYNTPLIVELNGKINIEKMNLAFNKLIERHEIFRTSFHIIDDKPVQKIHDNVNFNLEYERMDEVNEDTILMDFMKPFDLQNPPLIRAKIVETKNKQIFMIDIHHIICDGASFTMIINELARLYNGDKLESLDIQYKDYSEWINSRDLENQEKYWINQFKDNVPVLNLPLDYKRNQIQSFKGNTIGRLLDDKLCEKVKKFNEKVGTTSYMVFLSAMSILLNKYSRQDDILIGTPISGRTHKDTEKIIGLFVNTLVIRTNPSKDKKYIEFLEEVKNTSMEAYDNQEYPFEVLVEKVDKNRDLSRNPLFDVMFTLQKEAEEQVTFDGVSMNMVPSKYTISKFDISINIVECKEKYLVTFEYCSDLFKEETINNMVNQYEFILEQILENPEIKISDISTQTKEESLILREFNNTNLEYNNELCIQELFENQVLKTPNKIMLRYKDKTITYDEFNRKANKLARILRKKGAKPNEYICIMADASIERIIGIYAIIKSGACYVPIDPKFPQERIEYIIKDCKAKLLLNGSNNLISDECDVIDLFNCNYDESDENLEIVNKSNDLLYLIYTSGTTGKPKGVMIEHKNVNAYINAFKREVNINENSVVLQQTAFTFDVFSEELYPATTSGSELVIIEPDTMLDINKASDFIRENNINIMSCSPLIVNEFNRNNSLDTIDTIIVGGEEVKGEYVSKICQNTKVINAYGPTETTISSTFYKIDKDNVSKKMTIGKPISNTRVYILEENSLCGIGVPGEICIAGDGVGRGYLNNKELTNNKFKKSDLINENQLYHTGDLGRWLPNGNIEYLGRIDEQVKIRGYRIELGEIESLLLKYKDISEVSCVVREKNGEKYICSYVVSSQKINEEEIKDYLRKQLPEYMIPYTITAIDKIPLNNNGKVDKNKLPEIEFTSKNKYVAPRNEIEEVMVRTFEKVLSLEKVGILDNFFELGGDSIKAIKVVSDLKQNGYEITVKDLIQERTIKNIVSKVKLISDKPLYSQEEVYGIVPFTPIQKEFIKLHLPKPNHFNQAFMLKKDKFNVEALKEALSSVIKHHDILRSIYRDKCQEILKEKECKLYDFYEVDFKNLEGEELVNSIFNKSTEIQGSIDLEKGPLVKVALFRTSEEEHLLISIHHLVVDAVSWRIILEDLEMAYYQYINNKEIKLPYKSASFKEWAEALEEYKNSEMLQKEYPYWLKVSNEAQKGLIDVKCYKGMEFSKVNNILSKESTNKLFKESLGIYKVGINAILLSALGMAFKEVTKQNILAIKLEGHGREEIHKAISIERTVGWFTSIYPVIINSEDEITTNVYKTDKMLNEIPNNGMGYSILKNSDMFDIPDMPIDICFNYLGDFDIMLDSKDVDNNKFVFSEIPPGDSIAKENGFENGIEISVLKKEGMLIVEIIFNNKKYDEVLIKSVVAAYIEKLECIITQGYLLKDRNNQKIEKLKEDINLYFDKYEDNFSSDIVNTYTPETLQIGYLSTEDYLCKEKIEIFGDYDDEDIINAVKRIIKEQASFRSIFNTDNEKIEEYLFNDNWYVPLIDLTYSNEVKHILLEEIDKLISLKKIQFYNKALCKVLIFKIQNGKYEIMLWVQHAVWDRMSTEIFEDTINKYLQNGDVYNQIAVDKVCEQVLTEEQIEENFKLLDKVFLDKYISVLKKYNEAINLKENLYVAMIQVGVSEEIKNEIMEEPLSWLAKFTISSMIKQNILDKEIDEVPFVVTHHGRNKSNDNIMGLLIEHIPVIYKEDNNIMNQIMDILKFKNGVKSIRSILLNRIEKENNLSESNIINLNFTGIYSKNNISVDDLEINKYTINFDSNSTLALEVCMEIHDNQVILALPCKKNSENLIVNLLNEFLIKEI